MFVAVMVTLTACGGADDTPDDQAAVDTATPPAAVQPDATSQMGDAEVAHVAVTANTLDIEGGQLAKDKAENAEVKQFAERMITDHTSANNEANALAQRVSLSPADNQTSQQMKADHERAKTELQSKSGAEFDRAYIQHEVTMHQNVLNALDQTLIPNAQNPELKALLQKIRPVIENHLQMAQQIQTRLGSASTITR
jgi:putative membrane protein